MKKALIVLSLGIFTVACAYDAKEEQYKYSSKEVYQQMCSQCHGANAEGNPEKKGPALNDLSRTELEMELYNLESDKYGVGGSQHDIMEHNLKKIQEKGMKYSIPAMAEFIFENFNPKAKK